jgi:hypothetical protein
MTDEAAVLLRIAVFGFLVAVVYWFISYEPLGTVGFLVLGAGPTFVGAYLVRHQQPWRLESSWDMLRRFAGLPPPDREVEEDIEVLPASPSGRSSSPSASPPPSPGWSTGSGR